MEEHTRYRGVSDFGFGDKSWLERGMTADEAVKWYNFQNNARSEDVSECMDSSMLYYVEVDSRDDEEDWDWMDS